MNRRDFLKLFPSLTGLLVPASMTVAAQNIKNTKDLTQYIESAFKCSMGSSGPYITEELNQEFSVNKTENLEDRYKYTTTMFCSVGDDKVLEERRIAQYFYERLQPMKGHELIWRTKPEFDSKQIYEFGEVFMRRDLMEDFGPREVPDGVAYDFETDNYRYYKNKYWLHRIRMRIAIPEAHQQLAQIGLSEGERAKRIA